MCVSCIFLPLHSAAPLRRAPACELCLGNWTRTQLGLVRCTRGGDRERKEERVKIELVSESSWVFQKHVICESMCGATQQAHCPELWHWISREQNQRRKPTPGFNTTLRFLKINIDSYTHTHAHTHEAKDWERVTNLCCWWCLATSFSKPCGWLGMKQNSER